MAVKELAERVNDGVKVSLVWSEETDTVRVLVHDSKTGEEFEVEPAPDKALEAFYHPFAYGPLSDAA